MLAANETVAEDYFWQELPFVYRTHDKPDPEKVSELAALLRPLGAKLHTSNGELHPKELQKLLADIADRPEEAFISRLALAFYEAGTVQHRMHGAFRTGGKVLLSLYIADSPISGSADSPDYQGKPAGNT